MVNPVMVSGSNLTVYSDGQSPCGVKAIPNKPQDVTTSNVARGFFAKVRRESDRYYSHCNCHNRFFKVVLKVVIPIFMVIKLLFSRSVLVKPTTSAPILKSEGSLTVSLESLAKPMLISSSRETVADLESPAEEVNISEMGIRAVSERDLGDMRNRLELRHNQSGIPSDDSFILTEGTLLSNDFFSPSYCFSSFGEEFFISKPFKLSEYRMGFVLYVPSEDNKLVPRIFYASRSSCSWRYLVGLSKGHYSKGLGEDALNAPTEIQTIFTALSKKGEHPIISEDDEKYLRAIAPYKDIQNNGGWALKLDHSYCKTTEEPETLEDIFGFEVQNQQYDFFNNFPGEPEGIVIKDAYKPDFSCCISESTEPSDLYGCKITKRVFESVNKEYYYMFYTDDKGRTGIGYVESRVSRVTDHGIRQKSPNVRGLVVPVLEYRQQCGKYGAIDNDVEKRYRGVYGELHTNYLSKIPVIQEYQRCYGYTAGTAGQ